jgi:hypothetical protein
MNDIINFEPVHFFFEPLQLVHFFSSWWHLWDSDDKNVEQSLNTMKSDSYIFRINFFYNTYLFIRSLTIYYKSVNKRFPVVATIPEIAEFEILFLNNTMSTGWIKWFYRLILFIEMYSKLKSVVLKN